MTREEAIQVLKEYRTIVMNYLKAETPAFDMAIEALSADAVSREEYEELYHKAKEVNGMANDILADFPSYKELLSVVRCKDCRHYRSDGGALMVCDVSDIVVNDDDFCSYGERR